MPSINQGVVSLGSLAFRNAWPGFIIDLQLQFIEWNLTFDELIAKPSRLRKGQSLTALNLALMDSPSRSVEELFSDSEAQIELLTLNLRGFGPTQFQCLVSQLVNFEGQAYAWSVSLMPTDLTVNSMISAPMIQRLEGEITWSKYAAVYDSLLLNFPAYHQLLSQVSQALGDCRRCADLGTGTGNAAIKILEERADRSVHAIDFNEFMLRHFICKVGERFAGRLHIQQDDIERMPYFDADMFEAVTMVNSLYALNAPTQCLQEVHRILQPHGLLVITTPHALTNIHHLLGKLREALSAQGLFEKFASAFFAAEQRHAALADQIHRFTKESTLSMVEQCGFKIEGCVSAYEDAVVLVTARKA